MSSQNPSQSFFAPENDYEDTPAVIAYADYMKCTCSCCSSYRQKLTQSKESLMKKVFSQDNRLYIDIASSLILSILATLITFPRIEDFSLKQLYLENIFTAIIYYLRCPDLKGTSAIIFGGHFYWGFAVTTKSMLLTLLIMTCFQMNSCGLRFFVWCQMFIHLFFSCIAGYFVEVHNVHYLALLSCSLCIEYFRQLRNAGLHLEDVFFLLPIASIAAQYISTEDDNLCRAKPALVLAILWLFTKISQAIYTPS